MLGVLVILGLVASGVRGVPWSFLDFLEEDIDSREHGVGAGAVGTNCTCGQANKVRVVGGRQTLQNEFPLMAGIYEVQQRLLFCGAAIITPWHALTASHCTIPFQGRQLALLVGGHDITKASRDTNAQLVPIAKVIEHERYDMETMAHDITLLELKFQLRYNNVIGPACLPVRRQNYEGKFVKVLGWGLTTQGGVQSPTLQKANLRVINLEECARVHTGINPRRHSQICTWMRNRDSCDGDSGGPLLWLDPETNRFTLVGLVSFGDVCASNTPAVYTDVAPYLPWIQAKIAASRKNVRTCSRTN